MLLYLWALSMVGMGALILMVYAKNNLDQEILIG